MKFEIEFELPKASRRVQTKLLHAVMTKLRDHMIEDLVINDCGFGTVYSKGGDPIGSWKVKGKEG